MLKKFLILLNTSFFILLFFSESLWNDNYANIYAKKINYRVGDTITVIVDEQTTLEYKSNNKGLKTYNVNIQGGELSAIFSFLPKGSIEETKSLNDKDDFKIKMTLQGIITNVTDTRVTINATKQITINNKSGSIQITGVADTKDIVGNSVLSRKLANQTLTITTVVDNLNNIIQDNDLVQVVINPDSTTDRREETRLSEERKRALLIQYFNKILNLIF
ncbi:MAG TPA: flagellar basal body L-ring protein FlgH [Spirochaetota bacterium]|nr:flagellar basal body L-ring protein FlgH [Spirochaetota bacterium]HOL56946.1 flagellar basal body L-ring protein FlgH [Spirochaetota bacterium]HPP04478.1 flagellar basal body L-ring protein FlgH [Spirochaetota bacterium]